MKVWDCHVHLHAEESGEEVLRAMDAAGITRVTLFSRYPANYREKCPPPPAQDLRASIDHVAAVQASDPDRVFGMFWADPRTDGVLDLIEYALVDQGLHGVKMIPAHWAPTDELLFPIYEKMRDLGKPIHFHSGILYAFGDSSRFCRPVLYEALINFPGLKFALAHISWPWTDECLAVFGHFRSAAHHRSNESGMWIDCSRGTPDAWREDALRKAVIFAGCNRLMYGTDTFPEHLPTSAPAMIRKDMDLLRNQIGATPQQIEDFFWNAHAELYT